MIRKAPGITIFLIALTAAMLPARVSSANELVEAVPSGAHRWVRSPLIVSFSNSLSSPPANIKEGSDVVGALRRALQSWTAVADLQFLEASSNGDAISSPNEGDGVNLITVSTANSSLFESSDAPARTRVFYDSAGTIVEADIALNPRAKFSTDGSFETYDLESTFAHELGHLLGLEHSAVIGATMQPRQARNGTFGLPAISQRSLSEDDAAQARSLYGPIGSAISGRLMTNTTGRARAIPGANLFAEDVATGRVVASSVSSTSGHYRIDGLRAGVYRVFAQSLEGPIRLLDIGSSATGVRADAPPFRSFVASNSTATESVNVSSNTNLRLGFFVFSNPPALTPRLIGMNGELCASPLPLQRGTTFVIYVAGEGVVDVAVEDISISSRRIRVVPQSLREISFDVPYPAISFEVVVDDQIQPGDYTIRLKSRSGELAFLPGAITVGN